MVPHCGIQILNSYYNINPEDVFTLQQGNATRGHQMKLFKRRINTSISQHFFTSRVIQHRLPEEVVMAETISTFKQLLDRHWIETGHGHCQRPLAY